MSAAFDDGVSESSSDDEKKEVFTNKKSKKKTAFSTSKLSKSLPTVSASLPPPPSCIEVWPPSISFSGVSSGLLYSLTFSVQNKSSHVRRIRIIPPKTPHFALRYSPADIIAPGLGIRADIEFQLPSQLPGESLSAFEARVSATYSDEITVVSEGESVRVPIEATLPRADIVFESFAEGLGLGFSIRGMGVTVKNPPLYLLF